MIKKIALLTLIILIIPGLVYAQNSGGLVNCGATIGPDGKVVAGTSCTLKNLIDMAIKLINLAIQLAGVVAVIRIVQGGSELASSAAYGNHEQYQVGKTTVIHALLGLAWVLIAFVFVNAIWNVLFPGTFGNTWFKPWN